MLAFVSRRVLFSIPVLFVASFLLFGFVRATFDPTARLRASRDVEVVQRERVRLGLDKPLVVQYGDWAKDFVRGDWGESARSREDVFPMIRRALWNTMQLIGWGILISTILAVSIGVFSAVRQYSLLDHVFTGGSFIGLAMPPFWFGLIAIQFLAIYPQDWFGMERPPFFFVNLHSVDAAGFGDYARHLVLPVLTLTVQIVAAWSRYQRASMLDALSADYIRAARAKGVPAHKVVLKHGLRNALMPLITVMALDIGLLFGGLVVTEQIFSIPGMGKLFFDSLVAGDANVLVVWTVVTATFVIAFNLMADVIYGALDPGCAWGDPVIPQHADAEVLAPEVTGADVAARSPGRLFVARFLRHKPAMVSLVVLILLLVVCFGAGFLAPFEKNHQDLALGPTRPSGDHWFGTDELGRDQVTEIMFAGQISLKIGLTVALLSTVVGTAVGAVAGYFGRWVDQLLVQVTNLFLVVPAIAVLAIAIKNLGNKDMTIVLVLAGLGWMYIARVVRAQVLAFKEREFVEAARALGARHSRIIVRHILPNTIGPILVNATLAIAAAVVTESTLSFLGFGVQPPATSWGRMLSDASGYVGTSKAHLIYFPGLALLVTVLTVNFIGDGLRDAFDPQSRRR